MGLHGPLRFLLWYRCYRCLVFARRPAALSFPWIRFFNDSPFHALRKVVILISAHLGLRAERTAAGLEMSVRVVAHCGGVDSARTSTVGEDL